MTLPELLADRLEGEEAVAEVDLGGDDVLVVTPTRTLVYRADGLLSDESVEAHDHDVERVAVDGGRRKSTVRLDHGLDGESSLTVPNSRLDDVLHPLLAGILSAVGVTEPGETVTRTFHFSELTLVVTSRRLVKHVGQAVWDEDYEEFHYDDVTDVTAESGNVATAIVLAIDGRQQRFKAPNEAARAVEEALTEAICAHHGVDSLDELESPDLEDAGDGDDVGFGDGPDPLSAEPEELEDAPESATMEAESRSDAGGDGATAPDDDTLEDDVFEPAVVTDPDDADSDDPTAAGGDDGGTPAGADDAGTGSATADAVGSGDGAPGTDVGRTTASATSETDAVGDDEAIADVDEDVAAAVDRLRAEVAELREAVVEQREQLRRQGDLIEQLVEELRRGR